MSIDQASTVEDKGSSNEGIENMDNTVMNLEEDADIVGGENDRRFRYTRFYLLFCHTRPISRKEEIVNVLKKVIPWSILSIIILSFIIIFLKQVNIKYNCCL